MDRVRVVDRGVELAFSFEDMLRYSGPGSPAGVALAFKAMELAFPMLEPTSTPERREVVVDTAFRGPGARDGFELVTRCVSEGRYHVDPGWERPERGPTLEQFVFRPRYRDQAVTLLVAPGWITDEFVALARQPDRTADDERRFTALKQGTADRLVAADGSQVFEVDTA